MKVVVEGLVREIFSGTVQNFWGGSEKRLWLRSGLGCTEQEVENLSTRPRRPVATQTQNLAWG